MRWNEAFDMARNGMGRLSILTDGGQENIKKINRLLKSIDRSGYECEGHPNQLIGNLSGFWSVRIDEKNRIVFRLSDGKIEITQ